ncbi:MAG: NAD(P)-binding protein [Rhizobiales bacterium]|nr:NAD(P)-binding protein [Hyphomicrobiales bacterium]
MKVLVIGGGIGGLTTALSLHAAGIEVAVFEQVPRIEALGVGINLQPNAVRELIELGLSDDLKAVAIETSTLTYYNRFGQPIWSEPRGLAAGYAWPQYSIDRGDLNMILLTAAASRIGAHNIHAGHKLVAFKQADGGVVAQFVDRATGRTLPSQRGDVLVGADGIHSAVRAQLYPDEGAPVSSGRIQWRGVIEAEPFLDGRTHVTIGSRDSRAVIYPMSEAARRQGRSLINWVTVLGRQMASDQPGTWDRTASKDRFFARFKDWNFDWIPFADLIARTKEIFEYPKDDRNPLPRWSVGRVTLLGDAAHPMRPIGSQAGSQAVVDARVLALALATAPTIADGLKAYERERLPLMNNVILRNREFGPSIIMDMAQERAPSGFTDIEEVIPRRELEEIAHSFKVTAGFDPETLNKRASYDVPPYLRYGGRSHASGNP